MGKSLGYIQTPQIPGIRLYDDCRFCNAETREALLPYFVKFVDKVLSLRENDEPVKEFELELFGAELYEGSVINKWIQWAINRKVENLYISSDDFVYDARYIVPSCIMDCNQLTRLTLSGTFLIDFQNSKTCLPNLKSININGVIFGDEFQISNMLSRSPLLEEIEIDSLCITRGPLESRHVCISAPKLRRFEAYNRRRRQRQTVNFRVCAPSLECLSFHFNEFNSIVIDSCPSQVDKVKLIVELHLHVDKKIQQLHNMISRARELVLFCMDYHSILAEFPVTMLPMLHDLTTLKTYHDPHTPQNLHRILESAPNLKHINLFLSRCEEKDCGESHNMLSNSVPHCVSTCLESVEIQCSYVMEIIGFFGGFLRYANVLKTMRITTCGCVNEKEPADVLIKLYKLPRASTTCQIQIVN